MTTDITRWNSIATTYVKAYMRERLVWDTFGHDETDEWGDTETTSSTVAWTASGGSASDYSVADGVGKISLGTVSTSRFVTAGSGLGDVDVYASITVPVVAAGDLINAYTLARFVNTSNYYSLRCAFDTSGTVDVTVTKVVGGSVTTLGTANNEVAYAAGTTVNVHLQVYATSLGAALKAKVWLSTDDEPDAWTLEDITDNSPELLLGGVGFRSFLGGSNSNTPPVVLTFDEVTAFSAPQWTDITDAVLIAQGLGRPITGAIGRQTELTTIEPSNLSFALLNLNNWFTPDSLVSPYWPDWRTGTPLRWSETIGARSFVFPDMWLEIPEVVVSFESADDEDLNDRVLQLNAVDLLTRLNRAPEFVSNLAAYIVGEANEGALRAYWPLVDSSGSTYGAAAGPVNQDPLRYTQVQSYTPVRFDETLINFGSQDGPPGDDSTAVEFTTDGTDWARLANSAINSSTPAEDGVATLAMWVYVPEGTAALDQIALLRDLDTSAIYILIDGFASAGGTTWRTDFDTLLGSDTAIEGPTVVGETWHFVAVQLDFGTGLGELWLNDEPVLTGDTGGTGTGGFSLDRLVLDGSEDSASGVRTAHVQVYIGDLDAFTHEDFLAQYEVGINGFSQQTVDQRIRMICNYAGFPDSQLDIQESDSPIQAPAFAGQTPGSLATAAATTGGGVLLTAGDRLVYQDRKHRFGL